MDLETCRDAGRTATVSQKTQWACVVENLKPGGVFWLQAEAVKLIGLHPPATPLFFYLPWQASGRSTELLVLLESREKQMAHARRSSC